jgi:hypothetical protein
LRADERGKELPTCIPEEGPDEAEGSNDLVGIDFLAGAIGGLFFVGLSLTALPLTKMSASAVSGLLRIRRAYFRFL